MAGFRAYFDFSQNTDTQVGSLITLSQDESRHLCGSLRAKSGESVDIFDLNGNFRHCEIIDANQKRTQLKIIEKISVAPRSRDIYIAQCLPKGKTFDDIIRQSVEIGASGIFPLMSDRSQVKIDETEKSKKLDKWNIQVIEAIKQSANFFNFQIAMPNSLQNFLKTSTDMFDLKIVASLQDGTQPLMKILQDNPNAKKICILIGPEGDLSPTEYDLANSAKFLPATLGKNVMKSETASLFSLSVAVAYFNA